MLLGDPDTARDFARDGAVCVRGAVSPEHVELGFVDGSAIVLRPADGNAGRLLALARDVASAARS